MEDPSLYGWRNRNDLLKERDHTLTGLMLLSIGVAMAWIPYISTIGSLLALLGIIFVGLGRHAFGEPHHRNVLWGGALFLFVLVASFVLSLMVASTLLSDITGFSTSTASVTAAVQSSLYDLYVGGAVLGTLGALAYLLLSYGLADLTTKRLLWVAFFVYILVAALVAAFLIPQFGTAIAAALQSNPPNTASINALQQDAYLYGMMGAIPDLLFAYAIWRARAQAQHLPLGRSRSGDELPAWRA